MTQELALLWLPCRHRSAAPSFALMRYGHAETFLRVLGCSGIVGSKGRGGGKVVFREGRGAHMLHKHACTCTRARMCMYTSVHRSRTYTRVCTHDRTCMHTQHTAYTRKCARLTQLKNTPVWMLVAQPQGSKVQKALGVQKRPAVPARKLP